LGETLPNLSVIESMIFEQECVE